MIPSIDEPSCAKLRVVHDCGVARARRMADSASALILQAQVLD
jgi:hypothetical protein